MGEIKKIATNCSLTDIFSQRLPLRENRGNRQRSKINGHNESHSDNSDIFVTASAARLLINTPS
jgi:hypothetical protein